MTLGEPWSWKPAIGKLSRCELDREDPTLLEANIVVSPTAEPKENVVEGPDPCILLHKENWCRQ